MGDEINEAASLMGKKGGRASSDRLTKKQRKERAQKAAHKRWEKPVRVEAK